MIDETWTPIFVASAMTGPDRARTNPAGMSVTIGASTARNASRSRTRMNRSDSSWVWFCDEPDAATASIWAASWPVRWTSRPAGAPAPPKVERMASTTPLASGPALNATTSAWTSACRACPSPDTPRSTTSLTLSRARTRASSASIAALSAGVSPPSRAAISVAAARVPFWNGAASAAACMLGAEEGRNPLVVSFATSASDGR